MYGEGETFDEVSFLEILLAQSPTPPTRATICRQIRVEMVLPSAYRRSGGSVRKYHLKVIQCLFASSGASMREVASRRSGMLSTRAANLHVMVSIQAVRARRFGFGTVRDLYSMLSLELEGSSIGGGCVKETRLD
jgi:hypothetical protein